MKKVKIVKTGLSYPNQQTPACPYCGKWFEIWDEDRRKQCNQCGGKLDWEGVKDEFFKQSV